MTQVELTDEQIQLVHDLADDQIQATRQMLELRVEPRTEAFEYLARLEELRHVMAMKSLGSIQGRRPMEELINEKKELQEEAA